MNELINNEAAIINLSDKKILAVDDNAMDLAIISRMLAETGATLETALNSKDGMSLIRSCRYDIILLDHMMPDTDGITMIREIQADGLCHDTPIVVVTSNDVAGARENYMNSGFADYLCKPIIRESLISIIAKNLGLSKEISEDDSGAELPHILIVDDDRMNLRIAQKILEKQCTSTCVTSAHDAYSYLEHSIPDMILLDLHMPEIDGFTMLEQLKQQEIYKDIPVVCLTADNDRDSELKCFQLGALDFIVKPFIAEIVRQRLNRILELNRLKNNLQQEVDKQTSKLNKRSKQLETLTVQTMKALAGTIDAKDKYTNGHSIRVAEYSREIARRLNMSVKEQEDIYYMGLLHDIGKIGVPDDIINKTSRLTDEEYAIIKTHPVIGGDILKNMSAMPNIITGAKWHHERYDGKGYPDGLKGEDIPPVARIIGVADAYDAMTSNRSYRNVLPQEVVRAEIEKGMGTQFDPVFAKIMLKMIDDDKEYNMHE